MTYKELERQIQNINIAYGVQLAVSNNEQCVTIRDANGYYATVSNRVPYSLYISCIVFENLESNLRRDLLKAVYEFAQTPIEKRKLEQMYYISLKLTVANSERFLFKFSGDINSLAWGRKSGGHTKFTQSEIDYIKKKFNTDLSDFNIEEVEE